MQLQRLPSIDKLFKLYCTIELLKTNLLDGTKLDTSYFKRFFVDSDYDTITSFTLPMKDSTIYLISVEGIRVKQSRNKNHFLMLHLKTKLLL